MKLFFENKCIVGDKLYFTTTNTAYLFELDLNTKEIEVTTLLPIRAGQIRKFVGIFEIDGNLWFVPRTSFYILVYETKTKDLNYYDVPLEDKQSRGIYKKAICMEKKIFIVPENRAYIRILDIDKKKFDKKLDEILKISIENSNDLELQSVEFKGKIEDLVLESYLKIIVLKKKLEWCNTERFVLKEQSNGNMIWDVLNGT